MANVTYKISGKADNSALNDTAKGLSSLNKVAQGVQTVFKGFMAIKAVQAIGKEVSASVEAFGKQQKALSQLSQAVNNNANLSAGAFKRLSEYTSALQGKTIFGDEVLQEQAALLTSMGLTEQQIKDTLNAATELASAGVGTLEGNVKNLSKTYGGLTGELGESIPSLKNLTKEQLKNGEAVKLIAEQYKGFAQNLATNILEGKTAQVSNLIGDIKEKIGAVFAVGKMAIFDAALPILEKINAWFSDNLPKIINFFLNLPEIGRIALGTLWKMIQKVFTLDFLVTYLSNTGLLFIQAFKSLVNILSSLIIAVGSVIWEPLKYGFEWMVYGVQTVFTNLVNALVKGIESVVNFLLSGVNKIIDTVNSVSNFLGKGKLLESVSEVKLNVVSGPEKPGAFKDVLATIGNNFKTLGTTFVGEVKNVAGQYSSSLSNIGEVFSPIMQEAGSEFSSVLGKELPENIKSMLSGVSTSPQAEKKEGNKEPTNVKEYLLQVINSFSTGIKALGTSLANPLKLFQEFGGMLSSISGIKAILSPFSTILQSMFNTIQPVIEKLINPLVGILVIVGKVLGATLIPLLTALEPVISLISKAFVFLYNYAIRPLANSIIWVISTIYNLIANLVNAVIKALNKIPFVNIKWRMSTMDYDSMSLDKIDEGDLTNAGASYNGGSSNGGYSNTSGSSASYTAARDIIVNIYYEHSYINGDAREIALNIRKEIELAEKLGA